MPMATHAARNTVQSQGARILAHIGPIRGSVKYPRTGRSGAGTTWTR